MRYPILFLAAVAITVFVLVAIDRSREQLHDGKIPLHSGLLQSCATEIPPQPPRWEIRNGLATNLDGTVRVIVMADVCRNLWSGTTMTSAFHIVASDEHRDWPANMTAQELKQLVEKNTLVDLDTRSLDEIRPVLLMLYQLPPGTVQYDVRDRVPMRRDLGIQFLCTQRCDPAKIHIRNRTALGSNFYYVLLNPDPVTL
jgi:hypothetical protein